MHHCIVLNTINKKKKMKKVVLVLSLITSSVLCFGQEGKPASGKFFMAGSLGYSSSKPSVAKTAKTPESIGTFTLAPAFGYFINDKFALGARISYQKQLITDVDGGSVFGLSAFSRYYNSLTDDGKFQLFLEGNVGFGSSTPAYAKTAKTPDSETSFGLGVAPGFGWYPGKSFGVEFSLPSIFSFTSTTPDADSNAATSFQIGASTLSQPASLTVLFFLN
jgi:hypothetical protein